MLLPILQLATAGLIPLVLAASIHRKRDTGVGVNADGTSWPSSGSAFVTLDGDLEYHFQEDGNLVLYAPGNNVLWNSGTGGRSCAAGSCKLVFQADGNLVAYDHGNAYWDTDTASNQFHINGGVALFFRNNDPYIEIFTKQGDTYTSDDEI